MAKYPDSTLKLMRGTPDGFGKYYVGSTEWRKNALKRKKLNKQKK